MMPSSLGVPYCGDKILHQKVSRYTHHSNVDEEHSHPAIIFLYPTDFDGTARSIRVR